MSNLTWRKFPVELISILNQLIASPPNSKSAYFSLKPVKKDGNKWKAEQQLQKIACLILFPVVWCGCRKSHLIINTFPQGAAISPETACFPSLTVLDKYTQRHALLHFDVSHIHSYEGAQKSGRTWVGVQQVPNAIKLHSYKQENGTKCNILYEKTIFSDPSVV